MAFSPEGSPDDRDDQGTGDAVGPLPDFELVAGLLMAWRRSELRVARGFAECQDLGDEPLEDIYEETARALARRPYVSEEHLRNALRWGIRHRARHMHRDQPAPPDTRSHHQPCADRESQGREDGADNERAALAYQDRQIVSDFLAELTTAERHALVLLAGGGEHHTVAPILGIGLDDARGASRTCERKRERFQLLFDTGRMCGYRSATIQALHSGRANSEELAQQALAHLDGCALCHAERETSAPRLRRSFEAQAIALLGWQMGADPRIRGPLTRQPSQRRRPRARDAAGRAAPPRPAARIRLKVAACAVALSVAAGAALAATRALAPDSADVVRHAASAAATTPAQDRAREGLIASAPQPLERTRARRQGATASPPAGRSKPAGDASRPPSGDAATIGNGAGHSYVAVARAPAPTRTPEPHAGGPFSP
jgi:hypothetical protein